MNKLKNTIVLASLTLRFYQSDNWTLREVRALLVNPNLKITWREGNSNLGISGYYACYEKSGYKIFKREKILQHDIDNPLNLFNDSLEWYLK